MSKKITIACPECDAQFIVPHEYSGGIVDCSECSTDFEIQALQGKNMTNTDIDPVKQIKKLEDSTKTIAMSRNDLGMIPEIENVRIR